MENNKLIAEFMDKDVALLKSVGIEKYTSDELKYHTSWDWLKAVVDKIEQVHEGVPQELINLSLFSTIDEVYKAVIEFINQYNK